MRPAAQLICDKCGVRPTAEEAKYTAKPGGTHYRRVYHGEGIPGRRYNAAGQMRTCGTWIEEQAAPQ